VTLLDAVREITGLELPAETLKEVSDLQRARRLDTGAPTRSDAAEGSPGSRSTLIRMICSGRPAPPANRSVDSTPLIRICPQWHAGRSVKALERNLPRALWKRSFQA